MVRLIGLTGTMGSGKSEIAKRLAALHRVRVLYADDISKKIVFDPANEPSVRQIVGLPISLLFSPEAVKKIVFSDFSRLYALEQFVLPHLERAIAREVDTVPYNTLLVLESALLFELYIEKWFEAFIVATCAPAERMRRLTELRHLHENDIAARISRQWPEPTLVKLARRSYVPHFIVDTDCSLEELDERVQHLHRQLLDLGSVL